jgi:hypothetical protein
VKHLRYPTDTILKGNPGMNTTKTKYRYRTILPLIGIGLCVPVQGGLCQQTPHNGQTTRSANPSSVTAGKFGPLDNDPRLLIRVSLSSEATTIDRALYALTKRTGVKLIAEGNEVGPTRCSFRYHEIPLKELLESIAALRRFAWERREHGLLVLKEGYDPHRFDIYRPHSRAQAERNRLGRELTRQFNQLPPDLQHAMQGGPKGPADGVAFGSLPAGMQQTIADMIAADQADMAAQGQGGSFDYGNLDNSLVSVSPVNQQEGFNSLSWHVNQPSVSSGGLGVATQKPAGSNMPVVTFTDPRDQDDRIVPPEQNFLAPPWYPDEDDAASRREALSQDERLKALVTLHLEGITLPQALQELALKAGFSFVGQDNGQTPLKRKTLDFEAIPVKDALNRLAAIYSDTVNDQRLGYTWGERRSGILTFRPARPVADSFLQQHRLTAWKAFLAQFKRLSSAVQHQIQSKEGVAYSTLPRKLQQAIAELQKADAGSSVETDASSQEDLFQSRLRLEANVGTDGTDYVLIFTHPDGHLSSVEFSATN